MLNFLKKIIKTIEAGQQARANRYLITHGYTPEVVAAYWKNESPLDYQAYDKDQKAKLQWQIAVHTSGRMAA